MNKHRLGVSHRRGGLFYRLYFITVCHLHGGMLIASCDYLHIWKSTSICHVPPISHESVPPSPDEQLLFIHKVTGSARAWRHLHLTSCRLTYVNPATSAHVHTENISPCCVTPHRKKKSPPLLHHRVFSRLQYTQCVLAPFDVCVCHGVLRGFIRRGTCVKWARAYQF